LRATFDETNKDRFKQEFGHIVARVCEIVPGGVLIFVPSYRMMTTLLDCWRQTDIYERIQHNKVTLFWVCGLYNFVLQVIVEEPRQSSQLARTMDEFTRAVDCPTSFGANITGALLIGICRGKVSEGADFADHQARAVITLGIPFPNTKDLQVTLSSLILLLQLLCFVWIRWNRNVCITIQIELSVNYCRAVNGMKYKVIGQ
jgi:Rad3-related DNA helicase